jgi:hypothetical protein
VASSAFAILLKNRSFFPNLNADNVPGCNTACVFPRDGKLFPCPFPLFLDDLIVLPLCNYRFEAKEGREKS